MFSVFRWPWVRKKLKCLLFLVDLAVWLDSAALAGWADLLRLLSDEFVLGDTLFSEE